MSCPPAPARAPENWRTLPAVTRISSSSFHEEWVGSGEPVDVHPATRPTSDATCGSCGQTNTLVVWARAETIPYGPTGWGADSEVLEYELHCRDCLHFTQRNWSGYR